MSVRIEPSLLRQIEAASELAYPAECCGLLGGSVAGADWVVRAVLPVPNRLADRSGDRYQIDPTRIKQAEDRLIEQGLELIGFYHSHPDRSADPSTQDRAGAWETYLYWIVSVHQGQARRSQAWVYTMNDDRFVPESITTQE